MQSTHIFYYVHLNNQNQDEQSNLDHHLKYFTYRTYNKYRTLWKKPNKKPYFTEPSRTDHDMQDSV